MTKQKAKKVEEPSKRSTCVEPIAKFTDSQLLIHKLNMIKLKLHDKAFTELEIGKMLEWATDKAAIN